MGLIVKENVSGNCVLGMWEIKEDFDSLYSGLRLDDEEHERLNSFKNEGRKLEWLSVRNLINEMTGRESKIIYNAERKPFLKGNSYSISISHSHHLTSILLSKDKRVGIDLEYMSHKISKVSFKFINEQEFITEDPALNRFHLYIHWCAKEALYKICDKQDINFRENLTLFPFSPSEEGRIKGRVLNMHGIEDFPLFYKKYNNYAIVWTCKK
ncbi:MAG TPA: 4'-phosphopantetheinyl transferase superfamily protein [Bacteroidales bacterium]|nr:4'-phosphopantetheinyl transferase superfamily protein [Bacteroidales bacterium]